MRRLELLITDLDGSLLNSESKVSPRDQQILTEMGNKDIVRAIATGRNAYSAEQVLKRNPDLDYVIISTGLGIMDYQKNQFLKTYSLRKDEVQFLTQFLLQEEVDFMIHNILPDNHYVKCHDAGTGHPDFQLRWGWYRNFASKLNPDLKLLEEASQFLAFFPHQTHRIAEIRQQLPQFQVVRTTSPITGHYDWMEIFPGNVSKGYALEWLCQRLNIDIRNTLCLGNDYNDLDMLRIAGKSYVTENAPDDLKKEFPVTCDHNDSPLTDIVRRYNEELEN
ncbi:MAG: Cof-type HAD-IIB family hydrolase [Candidatus Cloacimonetes bacterium]|nr:Cof-type HAD-IIB family hydrolase [Candidatus Cloacimonadota bacterium]